MTFVPAPPSLGFPAAPTAEEIQNARVGYQAAVTLWVAESTQLWARFTAMILTNGALLATRAWIKPTDVVIRVAMAVVGVTVCLLWWFLLRRGYAYLGFLVAQARDLERYLAPVATVQRGHDFLNNPDFVRRHRVRDRWIAYIATALFAVLHILLIRF